TVNHIAMASHPTDIGRAPKNIFVAEIEDVLGRRINSDEITAGRVQNSLRLSGRTAGVKNVKRVLAVHRRRRTIVADVFELAMPPNVAPFFHMDLIMGALKNDHAPHGRAATESIIHISFQGNDSAAPKTSVRRDYRDRSAVMNAIPNGIGAKSAE